MLDIKWSKPYKLTDSATPKWRREWSIPKEMLSIFFQFWNANKFKMLNDGFSIGKSKITQKWYLYETRLSIATFKSFSASTPTSSPNTDILTYVIEPYFVLPEYTIKDTSVLRPWQAEASGKIISALKKWNSAVDGSDLGTGKGFTSMGVVRELNIPFVIVCPKAMISTWKKNISTYFKNIEHNCKGIINYELLIRGRKDSSIASYVLSRETKRKKFTWKIPKNTLIIWDEAHRLKNWTTRSSKICMEAYKQGYSQLFMSATLATSPLDMRVVGTCTQVFKGGNKDYYGWARAHGAVDGNWGLEFNNDTEALKRINKYLFHQRGVRLLRDQIPNFPQTEIIVDVYDMDDVDTAEIRKVYSEMNSELASIAKKEKNDSSEMAVRIRALQRAEMLKVPLFCDLINEGLDAGMSVAVFLNFSDTIDALAKRFNTECIYDGRNEKTRQKYLDAFQNNTEPLIITNSAASGIGLDLNDKDGRFPRLAIISPMFNSRLLQQLFGRVWRENSKSKSIQKIIYVANTQEENVVSRCGSNLRNLTLINNGKITDSDLKIG